MNYDHPQLRQMLAAEYVLGTLRGPARRRFENLARADLGLRREVRWWERRLAPLSRGVAPVTPPAQVWERLARHVGIVIPEPRQTPPPRRSRERMWRNWAVLASAASLALAVALTVLQRAPAPQPPAQHAYVAWLQVPKSSMHWTVSLSPSRDRLAVVAGGVPPEASKGKDAELWYLAGNAKPIALGVIPKYGRVDRRLPPGLPLSARGKLAVSLEPPGGSPTGQPTGPVILAAPVAQTG